MMFEICGNWNYFDQTVYQIVHAIACFLILEMYLLINSALSYIRRQCAAVKSSYSLQDSGKNNSINKLSIRHLLIIVLQPLFVYFLAIAAVTYSWYTALSRSRAMPFTSRHTITRYKLFWEKVSCSLLKVQIKFNMTK